MQILLKDGRISTEVVTKISNWGNLFPNTLLLITAKWNSLVVQWLGLCAVTAEGAGLTPGWGTKIPQAAQLGEKKKNIYIYIYIYIYGITAK